MEIFRQISMGHHVATWFYGNALPFGGFFLESPSIDYKKIQNTLITYGSLTYPQVDGILLWTYCDLLLPPEILIVLSPFAKRGPFNRIDELTWQNGVHWQTIAPNRHLSRYQNAQIIMVMPQNALSMERLFGSYAL